MHKIHKSTHLYSSPSASHSFVKPKFQSSQPTLMLRVGACTSGTRTLGATAKLRAKLCNNLLFPTASDLKVREFRGFRVRHKYSAI